MTFLNRSFFAPATQLFSPRAARSRALVNPVINSDFPDPGIIQVGQTYYAYATNTGGVNVQVATSSDLLNWSYVGDALPLLPGWVRKGYTWAPSVSATANGYVLYFVARHRASQRQCIGVATGSSPNGPFLPSERPLITQIGQGGAIDPFPFVDDEDGARYLLWKNDGNACDLDTWIYIQRTSEDGLRLLGTPTRLIKQDQAWEGSLVEAPTLYKRDGRFYLFYSGNCYANATYGVGYAVADSLLGPYRKAGGPILSSHRWARGGPLIGPGGQDIVTGPDGAPWLAYHAWDARLRYRALRMAPLVWRDDKPMVLAPELGR
jgi:arabinan endo-1,5-alpha-L-arabinosidase